MQRGDQGKFFKNNQKSSPRLKGRTVLWRKWHYPLISVHLKWKYWIEFWRKRRLQKCPNGQVMAILARSPKTRIFCKTAKEGPSKFFKNRPKSSPRLKGPKALWRKWHYPLIRMHLNFKDWRRLLGKKAAPKGPELPSYGNFRKVTQNPHFLRKCKAGTKRNFSKIAKQVVLALKTQQHSGAHGIIL